MIITYSGRSAPSARRIADVGRDIRLNRGPTGSINWGRATANTELNPDISNTTNKRVMRQLFKEHGVPMPELLTQYEAEFSGKPVVGRPDTHTRGRGFWLINSPTDYLRAIRGTRKKKAATHFMEFIEAPREYRVHVFLGRSIRISEKCFDTPGDKTSYTTGKPQHNIRHVRKAAKQAVEAVGLDFGCVDILADDEHAWVLEVNAAPGLGGTMPQLYAETFAKWQAGEWE